jgi:hypothetical protein
MKMGYKTNVKITKIVETTKVLYKIVGFNRATRPCAARSCLFRFIHTQNRALHCAISVMILKPAHKAYADQQLNYRNSPEPIKGK